MKKIKKKLLQIIVYVICWRNVDKLNNVWVYAKYNLLGGKNEENMGEN